MTFNEFWELRDDFAPINATTPALPLRLVFAPLSLVRWQFMVQMDDSLDMQESWGTQTKGDRDQLKRMLRDTNPYLLALTVAVTLLHSVFDMLAFKNDISFWRNRRSMQGLSLRAIVLSVVCQAIILLYLFDQARKRKKGGSLARSLMGMVVQPETSTVILISSSVGLAIEVWKLTRAASVTVDRTRPWLGVVPRLVLTGARGCAGVVLLGLGGRSHRPWLRDAGRARGLRVDDQRARRTGFLLPVAPAGPLLCGLQRVLAPVQGACGLVLVCRLHPRRRRLSVWCGLSGPARPRCPRLTPPGRQASS